MSRRDDLLNVIDNDMALVPMVDEILFLENQLDELKKLPFIRVNPKNQYQQKSTQAQKQYKELLQQYTNMIKVLMRLSGADETDEESPLRAWVREQSNTVMPGDVDE